jgi:hypothetical protein
MSSEKPHSRAAMPVDPMSTTDMTGRNLLHCCGSSEAVSQVLSEPFSSLSVRLLNNLLSGPFPMQRSFNRSHHPRRLWLSPAAFYGKSRRHSCICEPRRHRRHELLRPKRHDRSTPCCFEVILTLSLPLHRAYTCACV